MEKTIFIFKRNVALWNEKNVILVKNIPEILMVLYVLEDVNKENQYYSKMVRLCFCINENLFKNKDIKFETQDESINRSDTIENHTLAITFLPLRQNFIYQALLNKRSI